MGARVQKRDEVIVGEGKGEEGRDKGIEEAKKEEAESDTSKGIGEAGNWKKQARLNVEDGVRGKKETRGRQWRR